METTKKRHTICIDNNQKATLTGLTAVVSIFDKEIEVTSQDSRIIIRGNNLTASKLNVEDGTLTIEGNYISSVVYTLKLQKLSLKGMFK